MLTLTRPIGCSLIVLFLFGTAMAQETPQEPVVSGPLIAATATARRVRFVSPGTVVQLRLELYNDAGQKVFDTELHGGNVLDWHLQDGAGQRLATGSYACVLTVKSLSGRLSQRLGFVTVNENDAAVEAAGAKQLSAAQQQTIGPVEGSAPFTVLQDSETEALTVVTHDGTEGQLTSTKGALTFRTGDIFAGKDLERLRITPEGYVGIGTNKPEAALDVAGMIRAREGLMFSDGSTLKVNEKGVLTRTSADGVTPSGGTVTQDRIAKFTDNAGTLGDSGIMESATGLIGIGTNNPESLLQVGPSAGYGSTTGLLVTNNLTGSQFDRAFQLAPRQTANPATNSILMYALPTVNPGVTVPRQYGFFVDEKQGTGSITSYAALATGRTSTLGATNNTHLLMGNLPIPAGNYAIYDNTGSRNFFSGDVGIGTNNPATKLDVVGNINTSTEYQIGGQRILRVAGLGNTFAGIGAGQANTSGIFNSFFGANAGLSNSTGNGNSFFGTQAGFANTTGSNNAFFGTQAGDSNTGGTDNSFFGSMAGDSNTTGTSNAFFGREAGASNTTGSTNSFFGRGAGNANTTGCCNAFFGTNSGDANTTGFSNSFFGSGAGFANTTGFSNAFFGSNAGFQNTTGTDNAFFGRSAGQSNTTGGDNSFFGRSAGQSNTTGGSNAFFGLNSGFANTTGTSNAFFGREAGASNTTGSNNSFFGRGAGNANTTGTSNAFFGTNTGEANTTGFSNSFFGSGAGFANTTGFSNSFFGLGAGFANTSGSENSSFGRSAGESNTTGAENSFFGRSAGQSNTTGAENSFFGRSAGQSNTTGFQNVFVGVSAGRENTTGIQNAFVGRLAGRANTTGSNNAFFGTDAGLRHTTGFGNTFVGSNAGTLITEGRSNTYIGSNSGGTSEFFINSTAIGAEAEVDASNAMVLGSIAGVRGANFSTSVGIGTTRPLDRLHVNGIIRVEILGNSGSTSLCHNASAQIAACSSSLRYKTAVQPFAGGLDLVRRLRPITFTWRDGGMRDVGLGAEDVEAIEPLLVTRNDQGEIEGVKYAQLNVVLINAIRQQQTQIESLKKLVCQAHPDAEVCK